jgi:hypothetical protein
MFTGGVSCQIGIENGQDPLLKNQKRERSRRIMIDFDL